MPSERFVEALNEQITREFAAAHQYVAIGAFYDDLTFPRLARLFYEQADEERGHARRMIDYLLESSARPRLDAIAAPQGRFDDHVAPIHAALEQERKVSVEIGKLFEIARETRDHASEIFLQWFIQEQVEEEAKMQSLLDVAERVREFPMMLEEFVARDGDHLTPAASGGS
jgi:bacterioferritin B